MTSTFGGANGRRLDLDGLRGLAIGLVLVQHVGQVSFGSGLPGFGPAGVTVFFVLSGYLITRQLLREERIDLRNFYLRRVVRLGPALIALLAFAAVFGITQRTDWVPSVLAALTYTTNWLLTTIDQGVLAQTWSLSIEEQFYVVWPLVMVIAPRRALVPIALVGAIAAAAAYSDATYFSTFSNGGSILAGCALAASGIKLPRLVGLLGLVCIVVGAVFWQHGLVVAGTVMVIAGPITALVPIAPLGNRAYSLYLWNWVFLPMLGPLGLIPTVLVAEGSYRFVERPFMRRFHPRLAPRSARIEHGTLEPVPPHTAPMTLATGLGEAPIEPA